MDNITDMQYQNLSFSIPELDHNYGKNVHILSSPVFMTLLSKVCAKETTQPQANQIFSELYINELNTKNSNSQKQNDRANATWIL